MCLYKNRELSSAPFIEKARFSDQTDGGCVCWANYPIVFIARCTMFVIQVVLSFLCGGII